MYHRIVAHQVRKLFEAVNAGNAEPVLEAFAPAFEHRLIGETALGGTRRSLGSTRRW